MSERWKIIFTIESDGCHTCKRCGNSLPTAILAEQHWFDCTAGRLRRFQMWLTDRFITKHGFNRKKTSTKILEFVYIRYLQDCFNAYFALICFVIRILAHYKIEAIPYSGTYPVTSPIEFMFFLYMFISLAEAGKGVREYNAKVIKEIPNLQKELVGTSESLD